MVHMKCPRAAGAQRVATQLSGLPATSPVLRISSRHARTPTVRIAQVEQQASACDVTTLGQAQGGSARGAARKLVVAIDGNEGSFEAIKWTLNHLYRDGDVLHVLHAIPSWDNHHQLGAYNLAARVGPEEGLQQQLAATAAQHLQRICDPLAEQRGARWELDLVPGRCNASISEQIVSKCDDLEASVVVLSVRPTSLFEAWFALGVNKQVAARCRRPTLIFHEQ